MMHHNVQPKGNLENAGPSTSTLSSEERSPTSCFARWLARKRCFILLILSIVAAILILMDMGATFLHLQSSGVQERCESHERASSCHTNKHTESTRGTSYSGSTTARTTRKRRLNTSENYVVFNPKCQIPNFPELHDDAKRYYEKIVPLECSDKPLLSSVTHSPANPKYVLTFHDEYTDRYVSNASGIQCCYSLLLILNKYLAQGQCRPMKKRNTTLDGKADLVYVKCVDDYGIDVYMMSHFLVPVKSRVRRKMERFDNRSRDFLSVMIVGLDSVSRLGLLRNMPETAKYLEDNGWYSFPAYHKVGPNTFYNLNGPVLAGRGGEQLKILCWPDKSNHLDSCPFMWKNYSARNYITAYGEDMPMMDSFRYFGLRTKGFRQQPTDYLLRPLVQFIERTNDEMNGKNEWFVPECIGLKKAVDYILEFAVDFASFYANYPTFSLFWLNAGHSDLNTPQTLDRPVLEYFKHLGNAQVLNRTLVVFMSDHGLRITRFRDTEMGFVEDSMPFLYIWLPEWFREKHPDEVRNLLGNKHRLASHFDLHLTLMDVLLKNATAPGCPECVSLFKPLPWNRGCSDAGISPTACVCNPFEVVPIDTKVLLLAQNVAAHINNQSALYSEDLIKGYKCAYITIQNVTKARRATVDDDDYGRMYILTLTSSPNNAHLEAIVAGDSGEVISITEVSIYHHRSGCMMNREGKRWCTCERTLHLDGWN